MKILLLLSIILTSPAFAGKNKIQTIFDCYSVDEHKRIGVFKVGVIKANVKKYVKHLSSKNEYSDVKAVLFYKNTKLFNPNPAVKKIKVSITRQYMKHLCGIPPTTINSLDQINRRGQRDVWMQLNSCENQRIFNGIVLEQPIQCVQRAKFDRFTHRLSL